MPEAVHTLTVEKREGGEGTRLWVDDLATRCQALAAHGDGVLTRPREASGSDRPDPPVRPAWQPQSAQAPPALYALAQLKHGLRAEIRFNAAETVVRPLLLTYAPPGTKPRVADPFGRLENDGLWHLPHREELTDAAGNVREALARERDAPAGFTPEVLATFAREPEIIDVVALRLLERHFPQDLHEKILNAVGLRLGA